MGGKVKEKAGIEWMAGDEDYPFPSLAGEDPIAYSRRWLAEAPYARIERDGVRYIHEEDVANLVNAATIDLELLDQSFSRWGERLLRAAERERLVSALNQIFDVAREALAVLERDAPVPPEQGQATTGRTTPDDQDDDR